MISLITTLLLLACIMSLHLSGSTGTEAFIITIMLVAIFGKLSDILNSMDIIKKKLK